MTTQSAAVAIFQRHSYAEQAVKKLSNSGFDISKINIIGRACHTDEGVALPTDHAADQAA